MLLSGVSKSAMQMNLERSSDSLFFETFVRNARRVRRGMIDTYARPAAARRRGEAPRVASRGEHGHSSVITQPVNRFCSDRDGRRGDDAARASLPFARFLPEPEPARLDKAEGVESPSGACDAFPSFTGRAHSLGMGEHSDVHLTGGRP